MPRIPYPDESKLPEDRLRVLSMAKINLMRITALLSEPLWKGWNKLSAGLLNDGNMDPVLREVAILRVGHLSNSAYEVFHHEALGRRVGLSDVKLEALRRGSDDPVLSAAERAVAAFTDDVVRNVKASDETLAVVRRHLTDTEVLNLIVTLGTYMMVARVIATTGIELDGTTVDVVRDRAEGAGGKLA